MRSRAFISAASSFRFSGARIRRASPWIGGSCQFPRRQFSYPRDLEAASAKPFYITTPIFYVNAAPHVGHLFTIILCDILKRWQQLKGNKAILCTGTDEHGLKVQRAAEKAGIDPKLFCDKGAAIFKELAQKADITNDHFVRTTDREHKDAVEYAWCLLKEKGYIYTAKHEGWYSVTDEAFYPQSAVQLYLDPPTGRKMMTSIETGSEVEWSSEKNYHFRLSAFREPLLEFYQANPGWISPEYRMNDVIQAVEDGLEDLSISRPSDRLNWGIRVPGDDSQTIYVWLDALMNYATKAGYPWSPGTDHAGGWPADCHVIGKDIMRFHCIYWPAFLMALKLPLPKHILTHGHWTLGGSKMSKSTGRVVDPFQALDRFSSDVMRYFLARDGRLHTDSSYDNTRIISIYNKVLLGALGNLSTRVLRGKKWSVRGAVERAGNLPIQEWEEGPCSTFYHNTLSTMPAAVESGLDSNNPRMALRHMEASIHSANRFFQMSSPWDKALTFAPGVPGEHVDKIVYCAAEALRMVGILLQPFMPHKAKMLLDQLGVRESRRSFEYCQVGCDLEYGEPMISLGRGHEGALFPPLSSDE
ncbi:hypothetical protein K491DRAFT_595258 [Lophiostoma macrostomum CBS 122681]|uniref:Probable methionine--tRNA ligase, mitochondrial n=1 Tax=Lophiostoma macrostomum CBS 122681 TaxID=1314788 RepID=A0A6A6TBW2_9PLEO|nr:hypothetical protein K491DRAFT_595258 [Lophiostoma macrostomum CBS 122681]